MKTTPSQKEKQDIEPKKNFSLKKMEIIDEILQLKIVNFFSNADIIKYLTTTYNIEVVTARLYLKEMNKLVLENYEENFNQNLAVSVAYMAEQVKNEKNSFTRLQWMKELNKVNGLHIKKVEVTGQINHIQTIKLVANNPPSEDEAIYEEIKEIKETNETEE